ncbi:MAG: UvrB/UvrC motif-containing protein, partial [Alicyclobacillus sp.]|nr:UvrB/UvrC motif-containing protein [Alicyclobacillus sp.]
LLGGLLNWDVQGVHGTTVRTQRCDHCGMTYEQFAKLGRFGCPHCYDSFQGRLEPLLRRIQSSTNHTGKVPLRAGKHVQLKKQLQRLRHELQQAVHLEQFEQAAKLRDEIRRLEQQLNQ